MQRLVIASIAIVVVMALGAAPVAAEGPRREVNVTADSAPGWIPSAALEQSVRTAASAYLGDLDSGRYADAYKALDAINRHETLAEFSARRTAFNTLAGPVEERRLMKITWTKDPARAPARGVYAAIDLVSRFANIDRHCGFIVLYQAPAGGDFTVMRSEDYLLPNVTAGQIGAVKADKAWAQISANCPNYPRAPVAAAPLPEAEGDTIGYPTVAAALDALRSKRGVVISTQNGWTIADDSAAMTIWSFPPVGHPAYPSAVKRQVEGRGRGAQLNMSIQCEASKSACDDLVRAFQALNGQMLSPKGP
ncbi:DUF4019 domain-containing protein [Caulobacter hibisci]|uniref:DUF4019 domain-containing protein n=1 Tax=Caulobacter hibisci TaxID=2035993 RepID=A0ABS0SYP1_9CAUL|nr:DUF4019 domain-containing protein [Caulobacter hibisci]MBI1684743.1 DUF4019 domain-containing protein [Caulobacter hibisci]